MPRKNQNTDIPAVTYIQTGTDEKGAPILVNSEDFFIKNFGSTFTIWRYMDLVRFVSLLSKQALWFSRADLLEDKHEITYPFPNLEGEKREKLLRVLTHSRRFAHISSWHAAEHESMAMWEIYAARQQGIAIKSSASDLSDNIEKPEGHYGIAAMVEYGEPTGPLTLPSLAFCKRRAFEFEREFRILLVNKRESSGRLSEIGTYDPPNRGIYVKVNVRSLIKGVYVAPSAPSFLLEAVQAVVDAFGYTGVPVTMSSLYSDPFQV